MAVAAGAVAVALLSSQVALVGFLYLLLAVMLLLRPCQAKAQGNTPTPCARLPLAALAMLATGHVVAQYVIGGKATELSHARCSTIKRVTGMQCGSMHGMLTSIGLPWLLVALTALHRYAAPACSSLVFFG